MTQKQQQGGGDGGGNSRRCQGCSGCAECLEDVARLAEDTAAEGSDVPQAVEMVEMPPISGSERERRGSTDSWSSSGSECCLPLERTEASEKMRQQSFIAAENRKRQQSHHQHPSAANPAPSRVPLPTEPPLSSSSSSSGLVGAWDCDIGDEEDPLPERGGAVGNDDHTTTALARDAVAEVHSKVGSVSAKTATASQAAHSASSSSVAAPPPVAKLSEGFQIGMAKGYRHSPENHVETMVNKLGNMDSNGGYFQRKPTRKKVEPSVINNLVRAMHNGGEEQFRSLLHSYGEDNTVCGKIVDGTMVLKAAELGNVGCVDLLLSRGSELNPKSSTHVNARNTDQQTPLIIAARHGHVECLQRLLDEPKVQMAAKDNTNKDALLWAIHSAQAGCVRVLLDGGLDDSLTGGAVLSGMSILHLAVNQLDQNRFRMEILSLLLDRGVLMECRTEMDRSKEKGKDSSRRGQGHGIGLTPLAVAAKVGHVDAVALLLDRKANVNTQDDKGLTPFHHACASGHAHCVHRLCEWEGCDLTIKDKQGRTGDELIAPDPQLHQHIDLAAPLLRQVQTQRVISHIDLDRLRNKIETRQRAQREQAEAVASANERELLAQIELETKQDSKDAQKKTASKQQKKKRQKEKREQKERERQLLLKAAADANAAVQVVAAQSSKQHTEPTLSPVAEVADSAPESKQPRQQKGAGGPDAQPRSKTSKKNKNRGGASILAAPSLGEQSTSPGRNGQSTPPKKQLCQVDAKEESLASTLAAVKAELMATKGKLWEVEGELAEERRVKESFVKLHDQVGDELRAEQSRRARQATMLESMTQELKAKAQELKDVESRTKEDRRILTAQAAEDRMRLAETQAELNRRRSQLQASRGSSAAGQDPTLGFASTRVGGSDSRKSQIEKIQAQVHRIANEWVAHSSTGKGGPFTAQLFSFGSFLLGGDTEDSDVDMLVVVPQHILRAVHFFDTNPKHGHQAPSLSRKLQQHPSVEKLVEVQDAFVPCLKVTFAGVAIDLTFANVLPRRTGHATDLPQQIADSSGWTDDIDKYIGWNEEMLASLQVDRQVLRSINGVRTAHWIVRAVHGSQSFRCALVLLKQWAKARGVYGTGMGFLGGVSWGLLLAYVCREDPQAAPATLLRRTFKTWASWSWPTPVELTPRIYMPERFSVSLDMDVWDPRTSPGKMPILTPTYPSMNTTHNVSQSSFATIMDELSRATAISPNQAAGEDHPGHSAHWPDDRPPWWFPLVEPVDVSFVDTYPAVLSIVIYANSGAAQARWIELCHASLRHIVRRLESSSLLHRIRPLPRELRIGAAASSSSPRVHARGGTECQGSGATIGIRPAPEASAKRVAAACCEVVSTLSQQLGVRASTEGWYQPDMEMGGWMLKLKNDD